MLRVECEGGRIEDSTTEPELQGLKPGDPHLLGKGAVTLPPFRPFVPKQGQTFDIDRLRNELVDPDKVELTVSSSMQCLA